MQILSIQDKRSEVTKANLLHDLLLLGWTCIGLPGRIITPNHTNFNRTYFTQSRSKSTDVDNILRQFWEIEDTPSRDYGTMNAEDHLAVNKVKNSMKYQNGRYQVAIP